MKDPVRPRLLSDIRKQLSEQPPEGILMVGLKLLQCQKNIGKTVAEAAEMKASHQRKQLLIWY